MRGRAGTVLIVGVWLASWGLIWVDGWFGFLSLVAFFPLAGYCPVTRQDALGYCGTKGAMVWLPVTRKEVRHNQRAKLVRRVLRLQAGYRACKELISSLRDDEQLRVPVLEAERDAARREIIRLEGDIERLEEAWLREDREREYRKLTA